jgi:hypothetical protein
VEISLRGFPLYNRDFGTDYPAAGRALKDAVAGVCEEAMDELLDTDEPAGGQLDEFSGLAVPIL